MRAVLRPYHQSDESPHISSVQYLLDCRIRTHDSHLIIAFRDATRLMHKCRLLRLCQPHSLESLILAGSLTNTVIPRLYSTAEKHPVSHRIFEPRNLRQQSGPGILPNMECGTAPKSADLLPPSLTGAKRSVCIVGAGPAGLVAAKTILQSGQCDVTIYEKSDRLGGIWALDESSVGEYLSPFTPTNLSKFTVAFSDLSWDSVDFNGDGKATGPPMFPRAWQVNKYLEAYRRRYIPDGVIEFGHEVTATSQMKQLAVGAKPFWRITVRNRQGDEEVKSFDNLIVASGFFSAARPLQQNVAVGLDSLSVKTIHSSRFRTLEDLFPNGKSAAGKDILVIGGGNSSGEVAAAIASSLSNAQWSPEPAQAKRFEGCKIIHVTPKPLYGIPPFIPTDESSTSYVPVDFHLYNLSRRLPGPIAGNAGRVTEDVKNMLHGAMKSMLGGNQSDLGAEALVAPEGSERATVQVALSESYPEYVRSGMIQVLAGHVSSIDARDEDTAMANVKKGENTLKLDNIGAVVYATGYSPETALQLFHTSVKKALHYDPDSMRLPLILERWQTMKRSGEDDHLALIGFYEGPYWPIMEMQARLTAARWFNDEELPQKPYEQAAKLLELRQAMKDRALDIPQYWFGDYLGYMEELSSLLHLERNDGQFAEREGAVSPSRYLSPADDKAEAHKTMVDMHNVWNACRNDGKYVPRAVFRALHGNWDLHRRITSSKGAFPSGVFTGTASFHTRFPTTDKTGQVFDLEYIYIESGTFTPATGQPITASRRYVYRYSESADKLSVWFVKPDRNLEVDYLFHNLAFARPEEAREEGACVAKADHLCVDDMYDTQYRFPMKGIALHSFQVSHTVKGPSKDYVAVADYRRPEKRK